MKKKLFNLFVILSCTFIIIYCIIYKSLIFETIYFSMETWIKNIVPSLFPFFIISDILITYNVEKYIPSFIINFFSKLFNVSDKLVSIFFLSMISGFPSSAKNTRKYYDLGLISLKEANHILLFSHFSNPLFILSTVSVMFFNNEKLGLPILISHYLGNIIIGIILRNKAPKHNNSNNEIKNKNIKFGLVFSESIISAIDTLLLIFGTLTCFLIISTCIIDFLNINLKLSILIKSILEITMGLKSLSLVNISDLLKIVISSMIISFGGLSVHMQILSQISDTDISYSDFFIARVFHCIVSGVMSLLICLII